MGDQKLYHVRTDGDERLRLGEHECLMSFNDDGGCYAFHEWWDEIGHAKFSKWLESQDEWSHLMDDD